MYFSLQNTDRNVYHSIPIHKIQSFISFNLMYAKLDFLLFTCYSKNWNYHIWKGLPYCNICKRTFSDRNKRDHHIERIHEKKRPFPCEICSKSFPTNFELNGHVSRMHSGKIKFQCEKCEIDFTDRETFQAHLDLLHEGSMVTVVECSQWCSWYPLDFCILRV